MNLTQIIILIISLVIILFLSFLFLKTLLYKPKINTIIESNKININSERASVNLSNMLKIKTIADKKEHDNFLKNLKKTYPLTMKKLEVVKEKNFGILYKITGKSKKEPTVLMSHIDVVPAQSENWKYPAFSGEIKDGIIWGRGAIDNKATLCGIFEALEDKFATGDFVPENDLYIALGGDEELGGTTTSEIVKELKKEHFKPALVIDEGGAVVEKVFPSLNKKVAMVGVAEKGMANFKITTTGIGGHASTPPKDSSVTKLATIISKINSHPMPAKISKTTREMLSLLSKNSSFLMRFIFANFWLFKGLIIKILSNQGGELNAILRTTFAFTMVSGSSAANVLSEQASCIINTRIGLNDTSDSIMNYLKKIINDDSVLIEKLYKMEATVESSSKTKQFELLSKVISECYNDVIISPYTMLAATDSRFYSTICPNVFRFSTMELSKEERESIHNSNEKISIAKLTKCVEFYKRLIDKI